MWKPSMNCWWNYPDWELETWMWGVTHPEKPQICNACEFYNICFLNRTSHILGLPMDLSLDAMTQIVHLQRLQESWEDEELIWAYLEKIFSTKTMN